VYEFFFKKEGEGEEYKNMTADIRSVNCCILFESYNRTLENQNVPKSCPVKEVSIITHKPVFS
jgi:hypothetical protein